MQNRNRTQQQNDRMNSSPSSQNSNRPDPRFNRQHDTSGWNGSSSYQNDQGQRQNFGAAGEFGSNSPYEQYYNDQSYRSQQTQPWQQHEGSPTSMGSEGSDYNYNSTHYGTADLSNRQGYHPSRSMNEGIRPDSYSSSGMPQSSEQIGSRFYGDQTSGQFSGAGSRYGSSNQSGMGGMGRQTGMAGQYGMGNQSYGQSYGSSSQGSQQWGEHAGKGPKSYRRSEERIREDVCEALTHHAGLDASDIDVTVSEGVVTLVGSVESRQAKRMAEETIEHLSGVQDIKNELKVEDSTSKRSMSSSADSSMDSSGRSSMGTSTSSKSPSSTTSRTGSSSSSSTTRQ
jgi:osmotically-inducible protein OsmY